MPRNPGSRKSTTCPEGVLRAAVVDDGVVDDERAAFWNRVVRFANRHSFFIGIPVVQDGPSADTAYWKDE